VSGTAETPICALRYDLRPADALAYERLPGELRGWTKFGMIVSFAAIGGVFGLPEDWPIWWRWGTAAALVVAWGYICGSAAPQARAT